MIESFRTRFPDNEITTFTLGLLRQQRLEALRAGRAWEPFELGDPALPLESPIVQAEVNVGNLGGRLGVQGRWIARCPAEGCSGAEYVDFHLRLFMCNSCYNAAWGHQWLRVAIPTRWRDIETALEVRPPGFRNYKPGETVADLLRENRAHGLEV